MCALCFRLTEKGEGLEPAGDVMGRNKNRQCPWIMTSSKTVNSKTKYNITKCPFQQSKIFYPDDNLRRNIGCSCFIINFKSTHLHCKC